MKSWYEIRVDGQKVAAFWPIKPEALEEAYDIWDKTSLGLYKGRLMQLVERGDSWEEILVTSEDSK
tara:strand:+ start:771 stop:968 length:198 start_codon:yes stop_codon:yes gene_type:complete